MNNYYCYYDQQVYDRFPHHETHRVSLCIYDPVYSLPKCLKLR